LLLILHLERLETSFEVAFADKEYDCLKQILVLLRVRLLLVVVAVYLIQLLEKLIHFEGRSLGDNYG